MKGWNTFGQSVAGARLWQTLSDRLVREYTRRFGVPDVIHAHAALWAGSVAIRMAQSLARPCVVTEHSSQILLGTLTRAERREAARVYRQADAVLAVSNVLLGAVRAVARDRRGRVVPNAVDFEFFTAPPAPRRRQPFTFVSVSHLVAGKQIDRLVRAFGRLARTRRDVRLLIIGDGAEAGPLQRLVEAHGIAASVEFAGALSRAGVRERLWNANALVVASAFETFGVVLVEALATGIPVIATRCGGPEELVDEDLGLLIDRDDDDRLAEAMGAIAGRVYSESILRARVRSRFSFDSVAQQLLDVYATLPQPLG
jgi:glycosyltransferase involved in cell wall biosynthesis